MIKISNHTTTCSLFRGSISFVVNYNFTLHHLCCTSFSCDNFYFFDILKIQNVLMTISNYIKKKYECFFLSVTYNFLSPKCSWLSTSLYEENQRAFYKMSMFMLQYKCMWKHKHTWVLHWTSNVFHFNLRIWIQFKSIQEFNSIQGALNAIQYFHFNGT
jgi:hypothetical protein